MGNLIEAAGAVVEACSNSAGGPQQGWLSLIRWGKEGWEDLILGFLRMFHNDLKVYGISEEVGHLFSQRYEKYHIKKSHYQGALSRTKFFGKEV